MEVTLRGRGGDTVRGDTHVALVCDSPMSPRATTPRYAAVTPTMGLSPPSGVVTPPPGVVTPPGAAVGWGHRGHFTPLFLSPTSRADRRHPDVTSGQPP